MPVTEKPFSITIKELIYIFSLLIALLGQWYSHKAALNEAVLIWKAENALLRLELQNLKGQVEKLDNIR